MSFKKQWSQITILDASTNGTDPDDNEDGGDDALDPFCDGNVSIPSLDSMYANIMDIPDNCVAEYSMPVMYDMLSTAMDK